MQGGGADRGFSSAGDLIKAFQVQGGLIDVFKCRGSRRGFFFKEDDLIEAVQVQGALPSTFQAQGLYRFVNGKATLSRFYKCTAFLKKER